MIIDHVIIIIIDFSEIFDGTEMNNNKKIFVCFISFSVRQLQYASACCMYVFLVSCKIDLFKEISYGIRQGYRSKSHSWNH